MPALFQHEIIYSRSGCPAPWPTSRVWLLLASLLYASSTAHGEDATRIGHVLDLDGDWYLYSEPMDNDGQKLGKWNEVSAHNLIRINSPRSTNYITLVGRSLRVILHETCEEPAACDQPIAVPEIASEPHLTDELGSILGRVWASLPKEPPVPSLARARGAGARMAEGVVPIIDGGADLREVMNDVKSGTYSLAPYDASVGVDGRRAVKFYWIPEKATTVPVGNHASGLYEISPVASTHEFFENQDITIRVFLCTAQQCPQAVSSFQTARSSTDKWADVAAPETIHGFLRTYLAELAKTSAPLEH